MFSLLKVLQYESDVTDEDLNRDIRQRMSDSRRYEKVKAQKSPTNSSTSARGGDIAGL